MTASDKFLGATLLVASAILVYRAAPCASALLILALLTVIYVREYGAGSE